jgi:ubiquinone/menaquinone biosynthesis C-methylase UbiE
VSDTVPRAFPHQLAWLLNNRFRALLLPAQTLVARIPLKVTDHILEMGPGSGYFSLAFAAAIPEGHLELLDIQPQMLSKARTLLMAGGYTNVGYTVADAGTPLPFPPASFDVVVLVHVFGEVEHQAQCLGSLHGLLKPGGILALHEGWPDPDRIALPTLKPIVESHGFALDQVHGPAWNYTAIFRRT